MDILCIGDSLTYGYNVPTEQNWLAVAAVTAGLTLANYGVCGETTAGMKDRLTVLLPTISENAIFLMGGTNDLLMRLTAISAWNNLQSMAMMIRQAGKQVLWGISPLTTTASVIAGWQSAVQVEKTNAAIKELRGHILTGVMHRREICVDFYRLLQGQPRLYEDGIHPNSEGYAVMGKAAVVAWRSLK